MFGELRCSCDGSRGLAECLERGRVEVLAERERRHGRVGVADGQEDDIGVGQELGGRFWDEADPAPGRHLTIQLRGRDIELDEGELYVVPRGVEHCSRAEEEASVLLIEPSGTVNTGDAGGPLTTEPERI